MFYYRLVKSNCPIYILTFQQLVNRPHQYNTRTRNNNKLLSLTIKHEFANKSILYNIFSQNCIKINEFNVIYIYCSYVFLSIISMMFQNYIHKYTTFIIMNLWGWEQVASQLAVFYTYLWEASWSLCNVKLEYICVICITYVIYGK